MWPLLIAGILFGSPAAADPLIPVPEGCEVPPSPHVVFVGTVAARDYRTIRFEVDSVRSGSTEPFGFGDRLVDIRYGLDAQYLDDGSSYLVSAVVHPDLGLLSSRVTEPIEDFGGDEVIGVSESDVDCPDFEDAVRTLHVDGTPIEAGLLDPFFDAKLRVVLAIVVPALIAAGVIFVVAMFRLSLVGLYHQLVRASRR